MGFFDTPEPKLKLPPEFQEAMQRLLKLGTTGVDQPTQQIAGFTPDQLRAQQDALKLAGSGTSPTLTTAIGQAGDIAKGTDVTQLPEFKGTMDKILEQGRLDAQGIARGLQLRGAATGTPGRDILGRSVTGTQERLMAAANPFLNAERNRQLQATGLLGQLGGQEESSQFAKSKFGLQVTQMQQDLQNMINEARWKKELADIQFKYGTQAENLSRVIAGTTGVITGGGPSGFSKVLAGVEAFGSLIPGSTPKAEA